jgi:uncharacterized protein
VSEEARITFPCSYPIRIIGVDGEGFARSVLEVVRLHATDVTPDDVNLRHSAKGKYVSVAVTLMATGEAQLKALHTDLLKLPDVKLVL